MDISRPYAAVSPSRDLDVLKVLAGTTRPISGRQIARLAGTAHTSVQPVLERLAKHGLVHREAAGSALMYALNRDHIAAPSVEGLAALRTELLRRLRAQLDSWAIQPTHCSLFGSAARGDGDVTSDIDLLLVRPRDVDDADADWREQVSGLSDAVLAWTGNHLAVVEVPEADLLDALSSNSVLAQDLQRDAVDLAGIPAREMLRG